MNRMNRTTRLIIGAVVVVGVIAVAALAFIWFSGGDGAATAETVSDAVVPVTGESTVFDISAADSEVRFALDEDLRGTRVTVVGRTQDVDGQIAVGTKRANWN